MRLCNAHLRCPICFVVVVVAAVDAATAAAAAVLFFVFRFNVSLRAHKPSGLSGTGSPGRLPRLSHSS